MSHRPHRPASQTLAVALHGIEPATFEPCALIRDWLYDHGVDRVTLLVIPAADLHPVGERSPEMIQWLTDCRRGGDSIAQHGFRHVRPRTGASRRLLAAAHGRRDGEFVGLDEEETRRAVHCGWRVLKLAGIEPDGFVAPAYAYTSALREALSLKFQWWAGLLRVHRAHPGPTARAHDRAGASALAPALSLAAGPLSRMLSPALMRAGSLLPTSTVRLDIHPADLRHPRHMLALEWALAHSERRMAVTYAQLAGLAPSRPALGRGSAAQRFAAVNIDGSNGLTAERPA